MPSCDFEVCGNTYDDDCDGLIDCDDDDCTTGDVEFCDDGCVNTAGGSLDDPETCRAPWDDVPDNGDDDDGDGEPDDGDGEDNTDDTCDADGRPVDLFARTAWVGPHEDVRIKSPQGGGFDLVFSRTWDQRRSKKDTADDADPSGSRTGSNQWPSTRVLGPGWRHNYDVRLILEGDDGTGAPLTVLLDAPGNQVRLHEVTSGVTPEYGRSPGDPTRAKKSGSLWTVTFADGTAYEFLEGTGTGTRLHPWGCVKTASGCSPLPPSVEPWTQLQTPRHARLRTILPAGATAYRIRLWHEQDATDGELPPGACIGVVGGAGAECDATRGLLAAVAAQWWNGASWVLGSTLELKYTPMTLSARAQFPLYLIREGSAAANGAILAEYLRVNGTSLTDRVVTCTDTSTEAAPGPCATHTSGGPMLGNELVHYTWGQAGLSPHIESATILASVDRVRMLDGGALQRLPEETFTWTLDGDAVVVSAHQSPGVELSAPSTPVAPDGIAVWQRNGTTKRLTYTSGKPTRVERCDSANNCVATDREWANSSGAGFRDPRYTLGSGATRAPGNESTTLREFDEDGNVIFEVEVVPNGAGIASITGKTGTTCHTWSLSSAAVSVVRRATRHYYTSGSVPRRIASATLLPASWPSQPALLSNLTFPATAPSSWVYPSTSPSATRPVPANQITACNASLRYEVTATDFDSGLPIGASPTSNTPDANSISNALLNEANDRQAAWVHQVRTTASGGCVGTSALTVRDVAGRPIETRSFETRSASCTGTNNAAGNVLAVSKSTYVPLTSTDTRARGRLSESLSYANAGGRAEAVPSFKACDSAAYDVRGDVDCSKLQVGSTSWLSTTSTVTAVGSGVNTARRFTTTKTDGDNGTGTTLIASFADTLANGAVFDAGTVNGNHTKTYWNTQLLNWPPAQTLPTKTVLLDKVGGVLATTKLTYDPFGRLIDESQFLGSGLTFRRRTSTAYDDGESRVSARIQHSTPMCDPFNPCSGGATCTAGVCSNDVALTTTYAYDPVTGAQTTTIEGDGDREVKVYGSSGGARGRLSVVRRSDTSSSALNDMQSFQYDSEGRVTAVLNNSMQVAAYTYRSDGALLSETLSSAGTAGAYVRNTPDTAPVVESGRASAVERVETKVGATTLRDLSTRFDNLGRARKLCLTSDTTCATPIVEWVYDSKGALAGSTSYTVEGTGRSFTVTDNNQLGRLAYVRHPAGITLYEYDRLGRYTRINQCEGCTMPASGQIPQSNQSKMKVVDTFLYGPAGELTYMRYPSGRGVYYKWPPTAVGTGEDRRGPTEVHIAINLDGVSTWHKIASDIKYDVDGTAYSWTWGAPTNLTHLVVRDGFGRVTSVQDNNSGAAHGRLDYQSYDGDGDPATLANLGTQSTILPASLTSVTLANDPYRDMLTGWREPDGQHTRTLNATSLPTSETIGAANLSFTGTAGEALNARGTSGVAGSIALTRTNGEVTSIDSPIGVPVEVQSMSYGNRGDLTGVSGNTYTRDDAMRLWRRSVALTTFNLRYGPGGALLDFEKLNNGAVTDRDEYIYLNGTPIGVTHYDNNFPTPVSFFLSPDAMGTPRRSFDRSTFTQNTRLVIDSPWGASTQTPAANSNGLPALVHRLPGQLAVLLSPEIVENRYRTYLPRLGVYTTADPAHRASVQAFGGPQAYAYAGGRPLVFTDRTGRIAECCRDGDKVTIDIPITFTGPAQNVALGPDLLLQISSTWSGRFGDFSVTTKARQGSGNTIALPDTMTGQPNSHVSGYGTWSVDKLVNRTAAHEAGHLMGLIDRYDIVTQTPEGGWAGNIMGDADGGAVWARNIVGILKAAGLTRSNDCGCARISGWEP